MKDIKIGSRFIGPNHPLFITAETGVTCNYDMNISKELIDVVAESQADAIKFIFWFPDEIMSDHSTIYKYKTLSGEKSENMYDMLNKLRFSLDQWYELKKYADKKKVILFATINSPSGIEYAKKLNLDALKVSSWDFNNIPMWRGISQIQKPVIIDTGPATVFEIMNAIKIIKDHEMIFVHCYHTKNYDEINMQAIPYMKHTFNTQVGFSSTDTNTDMDIISIALGSTFIEKRLTLSRSLPGHHHILSMEPNEFKNYVTQIRNVQKALGTKQIIPSQGDLLERKKGFRSLVANNNIPVGTVITESMLASKRPENGISPEYINFFIGKSLKRTLKENQTISWNDV